MRLVKFSDGNFGVRIGWIFYRYFLLNDFDYGPVRKSSILFKNCRGSEKLAKQVLAELRKEKKEITEKVVE